MTSKYEDTMKMKDFLPFHMNYLTPDLVAKAMEELKETDENRASAIEELRDLILAEKNLKCPTDDEYLLQFLRARKFDVEKSFGILQNKYSVKKAYPDVYGAIEKEKLRKIISSGTAYCFPYRDAEGCVILVLELRKWNPDETNISVALCALTAVILFIMDDPATQVAGVRILVDVKGFSFRQFTSVTPRHLHLLSKALRNCLPARFKGIHIYNESPFFQYFWSLLKLFLIEKIRKRVFFHGNKPVNLHQSIPKDILTTEYGGENSSLNGGEWCLNEFERYYEKFQQIMASGFL